MKRRTSKVWMWRDNIGVRQRRGRERKERDVWEVVVGFPSRIEFKFWNLEGSRYDGLFY